MRHQRRINSLSRTSSHRQAMFSNMASSLIKHKRIFTTLAKAKALRTYVEPLITKSKNDTTHSRRVVFSYLQDKDAVSELFREVSVKVADRPGGYTRIIKTGKRLGDNAEMCMIELVDFNDNLAKEAKKESGTRKRSRRSGTAKKKTDTPVAETVETTEEAPVEEATPEAIAEEPAKTEEKPEEGSEESKPEEE